MIIKVNSFTRHPEEVGMTYFQHFRFAMTLAKLSFRACFASVVHAFFPFTFVTTTSRITFTLYNLLKSRLPKNDVTSVGNKNAISFQNKERVGKTGSYFFKQLISKES
jgi:hypothetical protein